MYPVDFTNPWLVVAAAIVAAFGVGRVVRLITYDDFPPTEWLRSRWAQLVRYSSWAKIMTCLWCNSPYIAAICMGWFFLGLFVWTPLMVAWWVAWGFAALSYVSSMIVRRDEPDDA